MLQCHDNLAQLQSCLDDWDVEIIQLGPARLGGGGCSIALPSARVVSLRAGRSVLIRGAASAIHDCLILSASRAAPVRWLGQPVDAQRFAVTGRGARVDLFMPADATLCVIDAGLIAGVSPRRMQMRSADAECVAGLLSLAESCLDADRTSERRAEAQAMDDALAQRIRLVMQTSKVLISEASARSLRAWAVERACRYINAHLAKPISLAALSRHCGVGIRTLEYSFRQFYDTTPISFIKSQRLTRTHDALAQADAQATTISKIAKRTGFSHMGQYCQDYRALFGESPSMTLQRASRSEHAALSPASEQTTA